MCEVPEVCRVTEMKVVITILHFYPWKSEMTCELRQPMGWAAADLSSLSDADPLPPSTVKMLGRLQIADHVIRIRFSFLARITYLPSPVK